MLIRLLWGALLAGVLGGLALTVIQVVFVNPLIAEAERFEASVAAPVPATAEALAADQAAASHTHDGEAWAPRSGFERTAFSFIANIGIGFGYALLLFACWAILGQHTDMRLGLLWGAAGFLVFAMAPALGMAPKPPGVDGGDLVARQAWWLGAAVATAAGLALIVLVGNRWLKVLGVALLAAPHVIGAPALPQGNPLPPEELLQAFAVGSLATSAVFWLVLGGAGGFFHHRLMSSTT